MRWDGSDNTKKLCGFYFYCGPSKKKILFLFLGGEGRADVNQQKLTKKSKFKFDKKSC